jgi:hypothetical protein
LRLAVFLAGLIFDTRRMASSKSMTSFKPVCFVISLSCLPSFYHFLAGIKNKNEVP